MEKRTLFKLQLFSILSIISLFPVLETQASSHKLSCNSSTHLLTLGSNLVCRCVVDVTKSGSRDALWNRVYGNTKQTIGKNYETDFTFLSPRYKLSHEKMETFLAVYRLEIKDLRLYDGVTIQCISPTSRAVRADNSYTIAVCEDTNSTFCACMLKKGWATPVCHEEKLAADRYAESLMRACVIIGLLMALMLVAAVVVTVKMLYRDITRHIENKRDERLKMQQMEEDLAKKAHNAQIPSQSILKKNQTGGSNERKAPMNNKNTLTINHPTLKDVSFSSQDSYDYNQPGTEASPSQLPAYNDAHNYSHAIITTNPHNSNEFLQNPLTPSQLRVTSSRIKKEDVEVHAESLDQPRRPKKKKKTKTKNIESQDDAQMNTQSHSYIQETYDGTEI